MAHKKRKKEKLGGEDDGKKRKRGKERERGKERDKGKRKFHK